MHENDAIGALPERWRDGFRASPFGKLGTKLAMPWFQLRPYRDFASHCTTRETGYEC